MTFDADQIGRRISDARVLKGLKSRRELAQALRTRSTDGPSNETIRLWETGSHVPPWDMVELLSLVLEVPEEFILFGIKRDEQLREERRFLDHVSDEEMLLLTQYRHASNDGKAAIAENAKSMAKRFPAPLAQVKNFSTKKRP